MLIRHRRLRRTIGVALVVLGALLMWLAPGEVAVGVFLLVAGIVLEIAGITLEHRDRTAGTREDPSRREA